MARKPSSTKTTPSTEARLKELEESLKDLRHYYQQLEKDFRVVVREVAEVHGQTPHGTSEAFDDVLSRRGIEL